MFRLRGTRFKAKNKIGSKFGANEEEKGYGEVSSWKTKILPYNYQFPPMTFSHMIVNWLLGIVYYNVPPLWTLSYKEVNHIKNGMRMWNIMKCFMSEVKIVSIEKVCWKSKIKDWDYMSAIKVWYNLKNDFDIKYMANNKRKKYLMENSFQSHVIFKYISESKECTLKIKSKINPSLTIIHNKFKIKYLFIVFSILLS